MFLRFLLASLLAVFISACRTSPVPQKGGQSSTSFGDSGSTFTAPENPKTASRQTLERKTFRDYVPAKNYFATLGPSGSASKPVATSGTVSAESPAEHTLVREEIIERSETELGAAQKDTAREVGARLAAMRGVQWVGILLLIGGPIVGIKMGWVLNGCIAGGTGLLLIILAAVIPGNEAWFGLGALSLIALVCWVYYKAQADANGNGVPDRLEKLAATEAAARGGQA